MTAPWVGLSHQKLDLILSPKDKWKREQHLRRYTVRYGKAPPKLVVVVGQFFGMRIYG